MDEAHSPCAARSREVYSPDEDCLNETPPEREAPSAHASYSTDAAHSGHEPHFPDEAHSLFERRSGEECRGELRNCSAP